MRQIPPPHAHLWPETASVDPYGHLSIAGIEAASLVARFGTPLYVYDEATLRAQCGRFVRAFQREWPDSTVAYAGKAWLSLALLRLLRDEGFDLDVVSAGEMGMALAAGFPADRLHLHGNFKPDAELVAALDAGVGRIVVDSLDELVALERLAADRRQRIAVWLRLCPDVATQTHAYTQTGHAGSKFGLDIASGEAREAASRVSRSQWLDLIGLHAHAGSHLMETTPLARVIAALGEMAAIIREETGIVVREISPGGGLAVAYTPEDRAPSPDEYATVVARSLAAAVSRHDLAPPRLIVEPGRSIVARAGIALYTIGVRKRGPDGRLTVAVDGGMGDNPRPALYHARYHAALIHQIPTAATTDTRVVGRYCESGDVLIERIALPEPAPGDVLAVPVSGAYHLPMASNYNGVPRPAVVFVRDGAARLVRRRESLDDLLRLEDTETTDA